MAEQRQTLLPNPKAVVVVGKIGCGNSTVLNNLYGLKLTTKSSPKPITTSISEHYPGEDNALLVIDTPGLGGIARSTESIISEVEKVLKGKDFTLLYCLPVKASDTLTESDTNIIRTIDSHLGRRVWDKCVLLLTFSDVAKEEFHSADQDMNGYCSYLQRHVDAFYSQLVACGIKLPHIKMMFDYEWPMILSQESTGQIIAVPVKKHAEEELPIIPRRNMPNDQTWVDIAMAVICNTSRLTKRKEPRRWYDVVRKNPVRSTTGTLVGAGLGALFGSFSGPWGSVIGAFIGAALGIALAIVSVLATKARRS